MIQSPTPRLVLASQSAARAALLRGAGLSFEARPAHIDETSIKQSMHADGDDAENCALTLANLKASRLRAPEDTLVIGADQLLVCDGEWFDKPRDLAAARIQLQRLRGREHELVTAIVCRRGERTVWHHVETPRLTMRPFGDAFLDDYLALEGDAVLGSVGAYRLEALGIQLFDRIEGEHSAILGLPLLPLLGFLRQHGVLTG